MKQTSGRLGPKKFPIGLRILILAFVVLVSLLLHTLVRTWVVTSSFEVAELRQVRNSQDDLRVSLRLQREKLMSPHSLERLVEELKNQGVEFRPPSSHQIIIVEEVAETFFGASR